ncbi:MAG TPA: energy transducer TonB, partial [Pyrinomonadaceae bacterium]
PTLDADSLLIPRDDRPIPYGDNKSTSTDPSSGPGKGGGIGTGEGAGVGPGEGAGYGPGRGGNVGGGDRHLGGGGAGGGGGGGTDYNKVFNPRDVTQKAKIISKPEPGYTEEARKNQISGTVTLRAVLTATGQVTNIRPVSNLPFGLTEKAIAAARQIKFIPAQKDGRAVSQHVTIEYNFNIY